VREVKTMVAINLDEYVCAGLYTFVIEEFGKVLDKPFIKISDTYVNWGQGLLTLAIDPKFEQNHFVYLFYTAVIDNGKVVNRLVRLTDKNDVAAAMFTLLNNIPASFGYRKTLRLVDRHYDK
jgi:Glucose / Sorbosone dehydrogenase